MDSLVDQVNELFFPKLSARRNALLRDGRRLVHYTSASTAQRIIQNREVWMRRADTMNDWREIEHGVGLLHRSFHGAAGKLFCESIDAAHPGLSREIAELFDNWRPGMRQDTYLTCVSEHLDSEDQLGRLSMWRAYGRGENGVALVLNTAAFASEANVLKAYSSPVEYMDFDEFDLEFHDLARGFSKALTLLKGFNRDALLKSVVEMLRFAVLCTKHPGFQEEREWRVMHSPTLHPSKHLSSNIETVGGVPQVVYKIPLKDLSAEGLPGLNIPALINRVIIGPSKYPAAAHAAFVRLLTEAGVADASKKVVVSEIPLRT